MKRDKLRHGKRYGALLTRVILVAIGLAIFTNAEVWGADWRWFGATLSLTDEEDEEDDDEDDEEEEEDSGRDEDEEGEEDEEVIEN